MNTVNHAYADDVSIVCRNANLQPIFDEYERLTLVSGLTLNADKTEVFNLIQSQANYNVVTYLGTQHSIDRVDKITICGMCMAVSEEVEYQGNVLNRIEVMEEQISRWGRRHLSINGRMTLAKTFLLSQIVFPAQFVQIGSREVKKIERLIYAFVNGARNLYGPERIARRHLKASREEGGINGIDVHSFTTAIALRQFGKAEQMHRALGALQRSVTEPRDGICNSALYQFKQGILGFLRCHPVPDINDLETVSSTPLNVLLSPRTDAARILAQYGLMDLYSLQRELGIGRLPRPRLNCVLRKLPQSIARLIRAGSILNVESRFQLITSTDTHDLSSTKIIKQALMATRHPGQAVDLNKIHRRQDLPDSDSAEFKEHFRNLWLIKHPALRAIRLRLCYKDIFSNERRHRFGLTDSPSCAICNQVESVSHQLLECTNAQRLWNMYRRITGNDISSMLDVITCTTEIEKEIAKSVIIKRLIQIDRSEGFSFERLKQEIKHYYRIEACISDKSKHFWERCIRQIEQAQ